MKKDSNQIKKDKQQMDDSMQNKICELEQILAEEKNGRLKALADYLNYKKQVEKERAGYKVEANKEIIMEIVDTIDDFHRALNNISNKELDEQSIEGLRLIMEKLARIVRINGIEEIPIHKGSDFDPVTMQALAEMDVEDETLKAKVIDVVQKGYIYIADKKVFKTAKIILGK